MEVMLVVRAFVLHPVAPRVLLVQRRRDKRNNPRSWEPPGGKVDSGELPEEALEREVTEEVGLPTTAVSPFVAGSTRYIPEGAYAGMLYLPLYMVRQATTDVVTLSPEHQRSCWLTLGEMAEQPDLTVATVTALRQLERWLS